MKNEQSMTSQESLDLIARMLRNTQERIERGIGTPFIVVGWLTAAVSLAVWWLLKTTGNNMWNLLWVILPLVGVSFAFFPGHKMTVTFIDRAVGQIWVILGVCCVLVGFYPVFFEYIPHTMIISLLICVGEAITGSIVRLRYVKIIGLIGIVLSLGLPFLSGPDRILGFGAILLISMAIPGHIMNAQARKREGNTLPTDGHV